MYVHSSRDFGAVGTDGASSERAVGKRPSAENSASNLCEKLGELSIHGRAVTLYIVSDDRPEMALAHRLWHQVYAKELANLHVPADRGEEDAIRLPLNGSRCILALSGGECVGTLRMSYAQSSPSEFEFGFAHLLPAGHRPGTLSRLVVSQPFRCSVLSMQILVSCFDYNARSGNQRHYDSILMTCTAPLLHYYYLFGFKKLLPDPVPHPGFAEPSIVVACSSATNARIAEEMRQVLRGHLLTRMRWALMYRWYRFKTRADRASTGQPPRPR